MDRACVVTSTSEERKHVVLRNTKDGAFYNPQGVKMTCRCLSVDVSIFWRKLEFNLGLPDIKLLPDFEFPSGGVVV